MSKLTEMLHHIEPVIRRLFEEHGAFNIPSWFLEDETGEDKRILATPFESGYQKDTVSTAVSKYCSENNIARYLMVSESWFVSRTSIPDENSPPPSECDDRMEAIIIVGADRDTHESLFKVIKIIRNGDKVSLVDDDELDSMSTYGRFTDIFKSKYN